MVEEDPCEDLDAPDKYMVWLCWGGAIMGLLSAFVLALHKNYLWPLCVPVAAGLAWCARKLSESARQSAEE
jgi:hypothetical protein